MITFILLWVAFLVITLFFKIFILIVFCVVWAWITLLLYNLFKDYISPTITNKVDSTIDKIEEYIPLNSDKIEETSKTIKSS